MPALVRPVEDGDLEALQSIDGGYARRVDAEALVERSVLSYYGRSGHAFVHDDDGEVRGFALAHAVWDGGRPVLRLGRLVGEDAEVLAGLLEAVVRSAYDAAVYDLVAEVPVGDEAAAAALRRSAFEPRPCVRFERTLGSRGRNEVPG